MHKKGKHKNTLKVIGPGILVAATGLGAGDMIAAAVGGSNYGLGLMWAVVLGAILKYYLNLGLAKWQLFSGTTLIQGWNTHLHKAFIWYFIVYLILWSFVVSGALISASGLAAFSIFKYPGIPFWGIIHAVLAFIIVWFNKYKMLERLMKFFIGLMFLTVLISALLMKPDLSSLWSSLISFSFPEGSIKIILGIIGGVGGSVTLMSYGYWIRENGWKNARDYSSVKLDLRVAYTLTAIFGISILIISSKIGPSNLSGSDLIIRISDELYAVSGTIGKYSFLIGFWGAVFSSLIGVFQGIPYLFDDVIRTKFRKQKDNGSGVSRIYKGFLVFMFLPPLVLLFVTKPIWMVLMYAVVGAFFMPFLAFTLLWLLNLKMKPSKNYVLNIFLGLSLVLFLVLLLLKLLG